MVCGVAIIADLLWNLDKEIFTGGSDNGSDEDQVPQREYPADKSDLVSGRKSDS